MSSSIAIELKVNDKGSAVVKTFSSKTVSKVKQMSDRSIRHVQRLTAKFKTKLGGAVRGVGTALMSLKALAVGALAGWGITRILGEFATFESALADMGKVTKESFVSIKKKIMDLPSSLGSATELVKGYYQVISAGVKGAANQIETLTTASKLAKTAHADQAQVITGLSSVMDAFKTSSMNAADALQTMEKTGKTTVGGLIPVIGELSSSSAALGLDLNEMGAAFAAVTLSSGGTEKAATQFKALMTSLIAPTAGMSELLKRYGGAQQAIKQIGFGGVLKLIKDATKGNATETKKLLGSVEGYMGFLSASANDMQTYNQNLDEQRNKTGAVDQAWKDYQKTLNAMWNTFKNTIGKQVIWLGERLAPAIKTVFSVTSDWLETNRELVAVNISLWAARFTEAIASIIESVPTLVMVFAAVGKAVSLVTTAMIAMSAATIDVAGAFAAMRSPKALVTAMTKGLRAATPGLAEIRDSIDEAGIKAAGAAIKFDEMGFKAADFEHIAQNMAVKIRGLSAEVQASADKQAQSTAAAVAAEESASQKMVASWRDKIVQVDGVWTNIKEKVMVPLESTLKVKDEATPVIKKVEEQAKKTKDALEKNPTISVNDQATSVLRRVQTEMAKIKSKTVYVKVVHTGTGSTERPLTEKIREIVGMYSTLPTQMSMNADFTQVTAGLSEIMEISNRLSSVESFHYGNQTRANRWGVSYSNQAAEFEITRLQSLYKMSVSGLMSAGAGSGQPVASSPAAVSVEQININVPNATPQTAEDWRMIVREHVIPELSRVGHA